MVLVLIICSLRKLGKGSVFLICQSECQCCDERIKCNYPSKRENITLAIKKTFDGMVSPKVCSTISTINNNNIKPAICIPLVYRPGSVGGTPMPGSIFCHTKHQFGPS